MTSRQTRRVFIITFVSQYTFYKTLRVLGINILSFWHVAQIQNNLEINNGIFNRLYSNQNVALISTKSLNEIKIGPLLARHRRQY